MLQQFLNFQANDTAEQMFGISSARLHSVSHEIEQAEDYIIGHYTDFAYIEASIGFEGREALSPGKVLEYIITNCAQTSSEELLILYCLGFIMETIAQTVDTIRLQNFLNI